MAFTDSLLKSILQKAIEIEKWAILERGTKPLRNELNFYDILDELRNDGKDGYAKELEKIRDELLGEAEEPPNFASSQTAFGLFKKLRRIIEDRTDDSKKLLLYADSIEDLIKDDTKLYPQIWNGEFEKLLDIIVSHLQGYDLFGELLVRIKEKDPTSATQLKEKYDRLIILSNVKNAHEDELKAVESAAFDLVSLMRGIAELTRETVQETSGDKRLDKKKRKKAPPQLLKEARERQAAKELTSNPNITCTELGKKLGCDKSTAIRLEAWKKRGVLFSELKDGIINRQKDNSVDVDGVVEPEEPQD